MDGMLGAFLGPYAALAVVLGSPLRGDHRRTPHRRREDVMPARFAFQDLYGHRGLVTLLVGPDLWDFYLGLARGS